MEDSLLFSNRSRAPAAEARPSSSRRGRRPEAGRLPHYVACGGTEHKALWQSVILQALLDAVNGSRKSAMRRVRAEAVAWFSLDNEDFAEVCHLAGFHPQRVLKGAKDMIRAARKKEACPFRKKRDADSAFPEKKRDAPPVLFVA
jgi:hypothetical protein